MCVIVYSSEVNEVKLRAYNSKTCMVQIKHQFRNCSYRDLTVHECVIYGSQWVEFQIPSLSVVGYMIRLM
jgi:hypothetical protein